MTLTTIDFSRAIQEARSASFEALPAGDYDVEVTEANATRSSNGKPMIKVRLKVLSGPYQNRSIINNFVFSIENAMALSIFFRHMKCFGLDEAFFGSLGQAGSLEPVAGALTNRRARVTLGIRQWNGEDRNEVTQIKPYTGAPQMPAGQMGGHALVGQAPPLAAAPPMPPPVQPVPAQMPQQASPIAAPVADYVSPVPPGTGQTVSVQATPGTTPSALQTGLDEFRPTSVPTQAGSTNPVDQSTTGYQTQPTSEVQQQAPTQVQAPAPPVAPELPI